MRRFLSMSAIRCTLSSITNLIYAGVDPKTVQYLAGHENSKITMDIYAKVKYNSPDALSTIVNNAFNNMYAKAE